MRRARGHGQRLARRFRSSSSRRGVGRGRAAGALATLKAASFDAAPCDMMMPDGGGEALWRAVREKDPLSRPASLHEPLEFDLLDRTIAKLAARGGDGAGAA